MALHYVANNYIIIFHYILDSFRAAFHYILRKLLGYFTTGTLSVATGLIVSLCLDVHNAILKLIKRGWCYIKVFTIYVCLCHPASGMFILLLISKCRGRHLEGPKVCKLSAHKKYFTQTGRQSVSFNYRKLHSNLQQMVKTSVVRRFCILKELFNNLQNIIVFPKVALGLIWKQHFLNRVI